MFLSELGSRPDLRLTLWSALGCCCEGVWGDEACRRRRGGLGGALRRWGLHLSCFWRGSVQGPWMIGRGQCIWGCSCCSPRSRIRQPDLRCSAPAEDRGVTYYYREEYRKLYRDLWSVSRSRHRQNYYYSLCDNLALDLHHPRRHTWDPSGAYDSGSRLG